jgi:uncharacterized protein YjdB
MQTAPACLDGQSFSATAQSTDAQGNPAALPPGSLITWTVDNGSLVTLNPTNGTLSCTVAGVAPGTATITATAGTVTSSFTVAVSASGPTGFTFTFTTPA